MARPQLHPRSGVYWLRKRVPADLVALVGRREEYFSLQTRDPEEAKRRHVDEMARLEARWAALRAGPRTITEREAHELAVEAHDRWLEEFREFPSRQTFWPTEMGAELWSTLIGSRTPSGELLTSDKTLVAKVRLQEWCSEQADILIQRRGLLVDDAGREQLARAVAAAIQRASLTLARLARGDRVELDGVSVDVRDVVRASVRTRTIDEEEAEHFTEVEMIHLVNLGVEFADTTKLHPYLRQVCPVDRGRGKR